MWRQKFSLGLIHALQTKIEEKWKCVTRTSPLDLALIMGAQPMTPVEGVEAVEELQQMRMLVSLRSRLFLQYDQCISGVGRVQG
jgi:hypothetical protein